MQTIGKETNGQTFLMCSVFVNFWNSVCSTTAYSLFRTSQVSQPVSQHPSYHSSPLNKPNHAYFKYIFLKFLFYFFLQMSLSTTTFLMLQSQKFLNPSHGTTFCAKSVLFAPSGSGSCCFISFRIVPTWVFVVWEKPIWRKSCIQNCTKKIKLKTTHSFNL